MSVKCILTGQTPDINDIGAVSVNRKINNKTLDADVTLTASDVGALPDSTVIPSKTSDLTNDSGFITSAPVVSVNNKTGDVTLTKSDIELGNVNNTSDADKPISTATQTALDMKQSAIITNGILQGDGSGNISAATETEVELVEITPELIGAQTTLTAGQNISITGSTIATKTFPCNPNLLDNWYFGNPVNQRGQTSYVGAVYGIDRWKGFQDAVTVAVDSDGLGIQRSTGNYYTILQYVEFPSQFAGKTVTFSMLIKSAPGSYNLRILNGRSTISILGQSSTKSAGTVGIVSITTTLPDSVDDLWVSLYTDTTTTPYIISAAKLEFGSEQTLAHQDVNGNWVLNEIPNYAEQLLRCQRHQSVICFAASSTHALGFGIAQNSTSIRVSIPLNVPMRSKPSLEFLTGNISKLYLVTEGALITPTAVAIDSLIETSGNSSGIALGVLLIFTVTGAKANKIYMLRVVPSDNHLLLNANL